MGDSGKNDSENKCDCNEAAPIVVISHSCRCSDGCGLRSDRRQCTSYILAKSFSYQLERGHVCACAEALQTL